MWLQHTLVACFVQAVVFGMGGGLLQKVNRDTMQFATKLCHVVYADGTARDIAKMPKSDAAKTVRHLRASGINRRGACSESRT